VDTASRHSTFQQQCGTTAKQGCAQLASDGQSRQLLTNVFVGVTAGLGVATAVTGFFVRWKDVSLRVDARRVTFDAGF
jgi:hypothetical protein